MSAKRSRVGEEEEDAPVAASATTAATTTTTLVNEAEEEIDAEYELIQEEHRVWKKNSPYLYDVCLIHRASGNGYLTCDWLPSKTDHKFFSSQEILLGTKSNPALGLNFLSVVKVLLPPDEMEAATEFNSDKNELANYAKQELSKFTPICKMIHDGDVDRARAMPSDPFVIATRMGTLIGVFNFNAHPLQPRHGETASSPQVLGVGHEEEGYGLDWNLQKPNLLASGGKDGAFVWNVEVSAGKEMAPLHHFSDPIADLQWDPHSADRFGTVNLQGQVAAMKIWDARSTQPALLLRSGEGEELNAMAFNPDKPGLFLTAGSSKVVKLWDERKPALPVNEFQGHMGEVYGLSWAPFNSEVFASGGGDRRVMLWDVARVGQEQTEEDKEDGPPEIVFIHGGHCGPVMDLQWNPNEDWMLASVSDDGEGGDLQIWRPSDHCLGFDEDDNEGDNDEGEEGDLE